MRVGERPDHGDGDVKEESESDYIDYVEEEEEKEMPKEEAPTNKDDGKNYTEEVDKGHDDYWVGKWIDTMEDSLWKNLYSDINQDPPSLNIHEVELMNRFDTQQAGLDMVHALRMKEKLQIMGMPQRVDEWRVAKGNGSKGRKK